VSRRKLTVSVRVPLDHAAHDGYSREQIEAMIGGIGKVIAAQVEAERRPGAGEPPRT
jgi:hypothetical protein